MNTDTFNVTTKDQIILSGKLWMPQSPPKAVIILTHGFGEHQNRYVHVAEFFIKNSIALVSYDLRGHGLSKGKRGHTPSYHFLLDDLEIMVNKVSSIYPGIPTFLYGHSFGGALVINFLQKKKTGIIAGALVTSPWLKLAFEPPVWKTKVGQFMNYIMPTFTDRAKIDINELSSDQKVGKLYQKDPLVHNKITARMYVETQKAGEYAIANANKIEVPTLLVHGTADKITSLTATQSLKNNALPIVEIKLWEGLKHETHNETAQDEVMAYNLHWMNKTFFGKKKKPN